MKQISAWTRKNLHIQGFSNLSDAELNEHKYGIRSAYLLCALVVTIGLVLNSIPVLLVATVAAFLGALSTRHPFDYIYDGIFRHLLRKPPVPKRHEQGQFACSIATTFLIAIIFLLYNNINLAAYVLGGTLLLQAYVVSMIDFCVPSRIYNFLFGVKISAEARAE